MRGIEDDPSIRFPFPGTWLVLNPPGHPRQAYDISRIGPRGRLTSAPLWRIIAGRARADEVFGWEEPVSAPLRGEVVQAVDEIDDRIRLNPIVDVPASLLVRPARAKGDLKMLAGNHVVIESDNRFAVLAHLRLGSVKVSTGDRVEVGQHLGIVGNSGNTLAPHLHLHLMDGIDFASARVLPFRVESYERCSTDVGFRCMTSRCPGAEAAPG
jgi:Peptidase family M23